MPQGRSSKNQIGPTPAKRSQNRSRVNRQPKLPFAKKLVLHQWLLSLFGVMSFEQLAEYLIEEPLEGLDENNIHRFHHALCLHLPADKRPELPDELLLEYDLEIVTVTQRLNERRVIRGEAVDAIRAWGQDVGELFDAPAFHSAGTDRAAF
jgi:hypothetical protein